MRHALGLCVTDRRNQLIDVAIAAALGSLSALLIVGIVEGSRTRAVAFAAVVLHIGPLVVRRRWPEHVLVAMTATAVATVPAGIPVVVLGPAALVAVYTVGARVEVRRSRRLLVAVLVASAFVVVANGADAGTVITNTIALSISWWLGGRARRAAIEADAGRLAAANAARQAIADERLRIARELHDVVAHAMSVIAVQAGTGRFVIDREPAVAAEALATIETTSRAALQEMRRLLAVLRDDDVAPGELLLPAPGLDDLDELARSTRDAGVDVEVHRTGEHGRLPAGLELCAYRVVQEALTNVRKHAQARTAMVVVRREPTALTIEVCDDGVGPRPGPVTGVGLVGLRERVALYGGTVDTGGTSSGFRVLARLPLESQT